MTTPLRKTKKPALATPKKPGGPVTPLGKARASENALTHGATAQRFLTDEERTRYQNLSGQLHATYASSNPLIQLQLERIAKLTIQLERIQTVIDALFQKRAGMDDPYTQLSAAFQLTDKEASRVEDAIQQRQSASELRGQTNLMLQAEPLFFFAVEALRSLESLLTQAPHWCRFLHEQASHQALPLPQFIDHALQTEGLLTQKGILKARILMIRSTAKEPLTQSIIEAIRLADLEKIRSLVQKYQAAYAAIVLANINAANFLQLIPAQTAAILPDPDQLDRLMRYQTSLQRQLSRVIGELLVLTRSMSSS